jgi:hypothetical protein
MIRTPAKIGIALNLLASFVFGQSSAPATGTIQGVVFTVDTDGARSVLPAATVSEVELEMKVQAVAESTTVTASAEPASPFAETRRLRYGHRGIHAADDVLRADRERPSRLHGVFGVSLRTRSGL